MDISNGARNAMQKAYPDLEIITDLVHLLRAVEDHQGLLVGSKDEKELLVHHIRGLVSALSECHSEAQFLQVAELAEEEIRQVLRQPKFADWFFKTYVRHRDWRRWWAGVAGIATIEPSAQAIERDNRGRKEQRMSGGLRQTVEQLLASGWEDMLEAEAERLWRITRVVDLRETHGHPPSVESAVKAARYCTAPRVGRQQHQTRATDCSMWTEKANEEGPWYMRHAGDEVLNPVSFEEMMNAIQR